MILIFQKIDWIHYTVPANSFYDKFMTFVNENGLLQFVLQPIRQEKILDLILSYGLNLISDLQVECPFSTSDHHLVKFSINTSGSEDKVLEDHDADHLYYDFRGADVTTIVYPGHLRSCSMRQFFRIGPRIDSHKGNFF